MNAVTKPSARYFISAEVLAERGRQDDKWGEQSHPDGTGHPLSVEMADTLREACYANFQAGVGTWSDILEEEVAEALAESDLQKLRTELVQVAAVCAAWIEDIDRRNQK